MAAPEKLEQESDKFNNARQNAGDASFGVDTYWDVPYAQDGQWDSEKTRFLRLHKTKGSTHGTVVLMHGGYWKNVFGLDDSYGNAGTITLAPFFTSKGYVAVELEYRRRDHEGGGWPGTNHDMLDALLCLQKLQISSAAPAGMSAPEEPEAWNESCRAINMERLIIMGHSAGGQLALWTAHQLVAQQGEMLNFTHPNPKSKPNPSLS